MSIPHRILIPLAATSLLFLAACGNKGPLVLPQTPVPVEEVVEPAAEPVDEAGDGQDTDTDTDTGDEAVPPAMAPTPPVQSTPQVGGGNG